MPDQWEEFLPRILSDEDKLLFTEAVNSARSGALRASYIMVWLSCAESIKRKFKELSVRDNTAKGIRGECDRRETNHQSVDHYLLDEAKKYGLITSTNFAKLEHIYNFRCVYGHPYETGPSLANIFSAASDVVELVLSRPNKLRHGYLSTQVDNLIQRTNFLDDRFESVERFASDVAQRCDDNLHWWFLEQLWKKAEALSADATQAHIFRRAFWFSVAYLKKIPLSPPFSISNYLLSYPSIASNVFAQPDLFIQLDQHSKEQVVGVLISFVKTVPTYLNILLILNDTGCFDERMIERFQEAIESCSFEDLASTKLNPSRYVQRIITALKSYHWPTQAPVVRLIQKLGSDWISQLTPDLQFRLGNNILQVADGGERVAMAFIGKASAASANWPAAFVDGIISECFINDEDLIRFKTSRLLRALLILENMPENEAKDLLYRLISRLRGKSVKHLTMPEKRDEAVTILQQFAAQHAPLSALVADLTTFLAELNVPNPFDF